MPNQSSRQDYALHIHILTGDPTGLKIISRTNWSGKGIYYLRDDSDLAFARKELNSPGIYFLIGTEEVDRSDGDSQVSLRDFIYIGHADNLSKRLSQHQKTNNEKYKDWDRAIAYSSEDVSFNIAFTKYIESKLIELSRYISSSYVLITNEADQEAKSSTIFKNQKSEPLPVLSDWQEPDAIQFLDFILKTLPFFGIVAFNKSVPIEIKSAHLKSNSDIKTYTFKNNSIATAIRLENQGMRVLKGSKMRSEKTQSIPTDIQVERIRLIDKASVTKEGDKDYYIFIEDVEFSSPSAAAMVILGGSVNGRTTWGTYINNEWVSIKDEADRQVQEAALSSTADLSEDTPLKTL